MNLTVSISSTWGYTLTIAGPDDGNLTLANQAITATTGTIETPTTFASQTTGGAWGFAIPSGQLQGTVLTGGDLPNGFDSSYSVLGPSNQTNTANYAAVPTIATPVSTTEAASSTADSYDIFFAASAGAYMPTGSYTGIVTISAFGNGAPMPTEAPTGAPLQRITLDGTPGNYYCPTTRTRVIDARDGNTYWVRRINGTQAGGGDLCWMETNLAYAGGGNNAYGDALPPFTQGIGANIASGQACYGNNATMAANPTTMCYWIPLNANPTSGSTDPSGATNGGVGINNTTADTRPTSTRAQFGYLYSWCTAMAGQPEACQITAATQPDPNISICPSGWRLPTGTATTGEFTLLNNTINGGATNNPNSNPPGVGLFAQGLYLYAGYFNNGSFYNQGSNGLYWSSTVNSATDAFRLTFSSSNVNPAFAGSKGAGFSVRCVAP